MGRFPLLVVGIILSGSGVLQRVAESISLHGINPAKMSSIERRLARFLANDRVVVTKIWELFLSQMLPFWHGKPLRLVLDCTTLRDDATIVYLGLVVHSRVLPLAWAVMPAAEKWQEKQWSIVANTVQISAMARSIRLILSLPYTLRFSLFELY